MKYKTQAFTLIELMVVVMILALLMTILIPTVGPMLEGIQKANTKARIVSLQAGIDKFQIDRQEYPGQMDMDEWAPVEDTGGTASTTETYTGSQVLAAHMFDYYDDDAENPYHKIDDDNPEPKSSYGQYEKGILDVFSDADSNEYPNCMADTFSSPKPIVYYPSGSGAGLEQFAYALNEGLTGIGRNMKFDKFINDKTLRMPTSQQVPFKDGLYLLISPGPDGSFFNEDDITNWR